MIEAANDRDDDRDKDGSDDDRDKDRDNDGKAMVIGLDNAYRREDWIMRRECIRYWQVSNLCPNH